MRRVRATRRRIVLLVLLLGVLVEGVVAVAVLANDTGETTVRTALPMHPVAGGFKPNAVRLADCEAGDQRCVEQAFGNVAYYRGAKVALGRFDSFYGDFSDPDCHRVAHAIGSATLARNKGNVARTFSQGSSSCFSGYYHGVLERSLVGVRGYEPEALGEVARGLCSQVGSLWLRYQCLHGLGHGLMITTGYTLPLSLEVCDRLERLWERRSCIGGSFMENITTFYGFKSRYLRDDDPVYPCNAVAPRHKAKCYQLVTSRILRVVGGDWTKTSEVCANVEKAMVHSCFMSLGRDSAGQAHEDPARILELCAHARPYGGETSCIQGASHATTANFIEGNQASALCRAAPSAAQNACYFGAGYIVALYRPERTAFEAACRSIAGRARDVVSCMRGARALIHLVNVRH